MSGVGKSISTSRWKPECGSQLAPAIAFLDADRLENLDVVAGSGELAEAGFVDRLDEGSRAAVHDRHFFAVDLDDAVIDSETAEGGEKMFDRADRDAVVIADHRAEREVLDVLDGGGDLGDHAAAFGDKKTEPSIGCCRMQNNRNWRSAVDPRPCHLDLARDRRLSRADKSIRHMRRPSMPCRVSSGVTRRLPTPDNVRVPKCDLR